MLLAMLLACSAGPEDTATDDAHRGLEPGDFGVPPPDGGAFDGGSSDGGSTDGGSTDSGSTDGGTALDDSACAPTDPLPGIVWREGSALYDDAGPIRFASVNIPNLHIVEDGGWHLPTEWEQRDALCAVRQIGGQVARTYVLSVGESGTTLPRHVTAPGVLEEELMVAFDQALAIANEQGVRLIVPFVDQWTHWGGIEDYAAFRGLGPGSFWTDDQVISDFEATITAVLTRVNSITGVPYNEDPAILAWETGNELSSPTDWTLRIAAHIRSLDPAHLIVDGHYGVDEGVLDSEFIDIVSNHYYWPVPYGDDNASALAADVAFVDGRRPFLLGEFGLVSTDRMLETFDAAVEHEGVAGALLWSLRFHSEGGGFYWHREGFIGDDEHRSFRWPGFYSGEAYGEIDVLTGLREAAWLMRGEAAPELPAPDAPEILSVGQDGTVSWRGSTGAGSYVLERAAEDGSWELVAEGFDDAQIEESATVTDPTGEVGTAWYRLSAVGSGGTSSPSEAFGPIDVRKTFTDPLDDLTLVIATTGGMGIDSANSASFEGDTGRLYRTTTGQASATWQLDGVIDRVELTVYAWPWEDVPELVVALSDDGSTYTEVATTAVSEGGDWERIIMTVDPAPGKNRWLRLTFTDHGGEIWNPQVGMLTVSLR